MDRLFGAGREAGPGHPVVGQLVAAWGSLHARRTAAPAAPTSLTAKVTSGSAVALSWGSSAGATSYVVSRATSATGPFVRVNTSTLTGTFINGANETGRTPFNPTSLSTYFTNVPYIGAVRDANDNWWRGWTCGLVATEAACTAIPAAG